MLPVCAVAVVCDMRLYLFDIFTFSLVFERRIFTIGKEVSVYLGLWLLFHTPTGGIANNRV